MAVVTEIRQQVKNKSRYSIFADGEFVCGVGEETCVALGLRVGQQLNEQSVKEIAQRDDYTTAMDAALYLLEHGDKTQAQLALRLKDKGYNDDTVAKVLARLSELGYANDEQFAINTVRSKGKTMGRYAIKARLMQKGVPQQQAQQALDTLSEQDELNAAAEVYKGLRRKYAALDAQTAYSRAGQALARRGFSWDIIKQVMGEQDED